MSINIKTGSMVSFELLTPALGTNLSGKFLGELHADVIKSFGFIPEDIHRRVYASLPDGTVLDDPYSYSYSLFESHSGMKVCYGTPWIDESSVHEDASEVRYLVEVTAGTDFPAMLKQQLTQIGIFKYSITQQT